MITLITGNPGAGKTLYCVSNLLRDLVGSVVKSEDSHGKPVETPRIVYTNINGLLLEHELIDGSSTGGLANWHEWAKPGAVICYDEVQREWKPRPNGSKVPPQIEALETHRHMGVDFILLTQHPGLLDQNIRALVGRHLHVRRFGGIGAAIVYEWDHCSRSLLYSKSLGKRPFRYSKDVFKLYKSAELHTKPKTTIPALAFVVLGALAAAAYAIPHAMDRVVAYGSNTKLAGTDKPVTEKTVRTSDLHLQHAPDPVQPAPVKPVSDTPEPLPPVPLDSLEYAGSMRRSEDDTVYLFKKMGSTGVVLSTSLVAMGYKVESLDGCAVTVSYKGTSRSVVCGSGDMPPPMRSRPSVPFPASLEARIAPTQVAPRPVFNFPAQAARSTAPQMPLSGVSKMFPKS